MLPRDLQPEQFQQYPPLARKLAVENIAAFRRIPLSLLPNLLRELIEYDYRFPAERRSLEMEIANAASLPGRQVSDWFAGFAQVTLSPQLESFDWVNAPAQFVEQLSAHLWTTHQMDVFRNAALAYANRLLAAFPPEPPPIPRLGIAIIGAGVTSSPIPLFRKLRPHGVYFRNVNPENGFSSLMNAVADRARGNPAPFAHWYIDGGAPGEASPGVTSVSYGRLEPARAALLRRMSKEIRSAGMGPEQLRTIMARMRPADLGLGDQDPVLGRFQVTLLTEGSGTQVFSTTFVQWAAREALRRAQPLTILARFAPRQRQRQMSELLARPDTRAELDPAGSLIDGDMGAYYNWVNQQRLAGAEQSRFVSWFEGQNQAVVIAPSMPRGTESSMSATIADLLKWIA